MPPEMVLSQNCLQRCKVDGTNPCVPAQLDSDAIRALDRWLDTPAVSALAGAPASAAAGFHPHLSCTSCAWNAAGKERRRAGQNQQQAKKAAKRVPPPPPRRRGGSLRPHDRLRVRIQTDRPAFSTATVCAPWHRRSQAPPLPQPRTPNPPRCAVRRLLAPLGCGGRRVRGGRARSHAARRLWRGNYPPRARPIRF